MPSKCHPKLRVAAVQAAPVYFDIDGTIDKTINLMKEAADQGVDLISFPETWIPGYPWWIWLMTPAEGMQKYVQKYFDNSLEVGSPEFQRIADAAKNLGIYVSIGFSERDAGSLYIAQALFDKEGKLVKTRRKLKPTHVERSVFGDGDGSDLSVEKLPIGNVGMLCCWEHLQPLTKYAMYAQNEQIHLAAWPSFSMYNGIANALSGEVNTSVSQVYAVEGQCFFVGASAVVSQEMQAFLCGDDESRKALFALGGGFARIFAPDGSSLGTILEPDQEGLIIADIDLSVISLSKSAADPAGHYARPDVTRLFLNKTPGDRVVTQWSPESIPETLAENIPELEDAK